MSTLRRFNPYALPDATIDRLATGRQEVLEDIVRHAEANLRSRPVQHVQIVAPRGFGKSFLMRMVQSALRCKRENGWPVAVTLLPEEQRNVRRPHLFLEEIRRVLEGRPASDLRVRWSEAHPQWDTGVVALDAAVVKKVGPNGLLIVIVENFDHLLTTVFRESNDQMQLRGWLSREASRIMLLTTALRQVDTDYAKPLFQAFTQLRLPPWTEEDCLAFFDRVRAHATLETLSDGERARARAIAVFSGGSPRIATVLYEVLQTKDALTAAAVLDKLVDELSDYYRNRIDLLSPRAQDVLDTLLRLGEPRSQTEVAAAMGQSQSRVAEVFGELTSDQILSDHPAATSRATLYQATDRLMVHFYRTRYFDPERRVSALEAITDFLAGFFSTEELRSEAQRLHAAGHSHEANVFERLLRSPAAQEITSSGNDELQTVRSPEERLARALRHLEAAQEAGDRRGQIEALIDTGDAQGDMGDHVAAIATLRDAVARAEAAGDPSGQAKSLRFIAWSQGEQGAHSAAITTLRDAVTHAEAANDLFQQAVALREIGWNQVGRASKWR